MRALCVALGLLLLGALRAVPQDRASKDTCDGSPSHFYNKTLRKCCYRCPSGQSGQQLCPQRSTDCRKQCQTNYYLGKANHCLACVSCLRDDLVEKMPCTNISPRVCECQRGMFCASPAINSCARCMPHTVCPAGMVVKLPGTAEKDTICVPTPRGIHPGCTSSEDCKTPIRSEAPGATAMSSVNPEGKSSQPRCPPGSADCRKQCAPDYYLDKAGRCVACVSCLRDDLVEKTPCTWNSPRVCECRPGMVCTTSAANSCARCITRPPCPTGVSGKDKDMALRATTDGLPPSLGTHPDCSTSPQESETPNSGITAFLSTTHAWEETFRSTSPPAVLSSTGKPNPDAGTVLFWVTLVLVLLLVSGTFLLFHWRACRKGLQQKLHLCFPGQTLQFTPEPADSRPTTNHTQPSRSTTVTEAGLEEQSVVSLLRVDACPSEGTACLERERLLGASPAEGPSSPRDLPEPRVTSEHTNNKIEKIYIMKADTVIVGTVKTEALEGRGQAMPAEPEAEAEAELEADHAPHYPEQETEPPLGSCGDVMFSVEEEGKEEPLSLEK